MDQALPVSTDLAHALSTPDIATSTPGDSLPAVKPVPSKEDFWRKAIHDQAASGKSILDFCHERGFAYGTFHRWKRSLSGSVCAETDSASSEAMSTAQDSSKINSPEPHASSATPAQPTTPPLPRFAEIKLAATHRQAEDHASSDLELRYGKFSLSVRPDCDRTLLRDLLLMLGEIPC